MSESEFDKTGILPNEKQRNKRTYRNPYLDDMKEDVLYHLALGTSSHDLREMYADVKFVCVGGTIERMSSFALYLEEELNLPRRKDNLDCIGGESPRYAIFKSGPVLCVSHGIGCPSISIVLHEVMKLLYRACAKDVVFIRMGTCGGIGLDPGTLVISSEAVDGLLRPYQELKILGRVIQRPARLNADLANVLQNIGKANFSECATVIGRTMCTDDFYEGQGRLDGVFCEFTEEEKLSYLKKLVNMNICNIEMESLVFAAMCANAGYKGAVICVTLLDRLKGDQVTASKDTLQEWQKRLMKLVAMFIKQQLQHRMKN